MERKRKMICGGEVKVAPYLEILNQVELGASLKSINETVGYEGAENPYMASSYEWKIGNGGLKAGFADGDTSRTHVIGLRVIYDEDDLINYKIVYGDMDVLEARVKEGITYDRFKAFMGGVDGVLVAKSRWTKEYVWQKRKFTYIKASFCADTNRCTFFTGFT